MALPRTAEGHLVYQPDGAVLEDFFFDDDNRVQIIQGPIESGTSSCCCHKLFRYALKQEPDADGVRRTHWLVGRNSYPQLEKSTARTWIAWFPEATYGEFRFSKPMTQRIIMPHPSGDGTSIDMLVTMMGLDNVDQVVSDMASLEITGAWLNEIQFMEKGVLDEVLSRCGRYPSKKDGPGASWFGIIADLNAPKEGHWIPYMRGDLPLPSDWSEDDRAEYVRPDDWKFYLQPPGLIEKVVEGQIQYEPNPAAENQKWQTQPYIEKIKGKSREWINERVMNRVGLYRAGQPVYPQFVEAEHVSPKPLEPSENAPLIIGLDFGREPAAIITQNLNESWRVYAEVLSSNASADIFAPKLRRFLAQNFPGFEYRFYGDPRGADGSQNEESTAYTIFQKHGMRVMAATRDNNPELRKSALGAVLQRRSGLLVDPGCRVLKTGLAGGYHYAKIRHNGLYKDKPEKDQYSHPVEGLENAVLGGGEGYSVLHGADRARPTVGRQKRKRLRLARANR